MVGVPSRSLKAEGECCALWKTNHAEGPARVLASLGSRRKCEAAQAAGEDRIGDGAFVLPNEKQYRGQPFIQDYEVICLLQISTNSRVLLF